ncbi:hypothetical protein Dda_5004 [Drechslerella dactyloides]|uniref:Uncharacterized protein n=1 Tax=Drechslerella dactyloides TaxID=74499 RepID=A0AAD6J085_DREDA|nr:hypothetical protein Dda_5004 [Drechslerella dactyloides]
MEGSRKSSRIYRPKVTPWLAVTLLLLFPSFIHGFWQESLIDSEESRQEVAGFNQGKSEELKAYDCKQAGPAYARSTVNGVVVWNRPDSFVTLGFALYYSRDCTAMRGKNKARPRVMMIFDTTRLRGMHVANLMRLGIQSECKSWQSVKVQEELLPGGSLAGLKPEELPGSVIHWDESRTPHVIRNAMTFINAVDYERFTRRRAVGNLLRAVLEKEIWFNAPDAEIPEDLGNMIEGLNQQIGVASSEIWDPPVSSLPGGADDLLLEVNDGYVAKAPPPRPPADDLLATALNLGVLDGSMTLDEIINQPIPMDDLLESFDAVPDQPEAKELWYRRIEARMMFNLRVLTNSWRILWAWQQARAEQASAADPEDANIAVEEDQQFGEENLLEGSPQEVEEQEYLVQDENTRPAQVGVPGTPMRARWAPIEGTNEATQDNLAPNEQEFDESYRVEIEDEPIEGNPMRIGEPATGNQLIEEVIPDNTQELEVQPDEISSNPLSGFPNFDVSALQFDDDFVTFDTGLMTDFGRRFRDHEELLREQRERFNALMGTNLIEGFEFPEQEENANIVQQAGLLEEDSDDDNSILSLKLTKKQKPNPGGGR